MYDGGTGSFQGNAITDNGDAGIHVSKKGNPVCDGPHYSVQTPFHPPPTLSSSSGAPKRKGPEGGGGGRGQCGHSPGPGCPLQRLPIQECQRDRVCGVEACQEYFAPTRHPMTQFCAGGPPTRSISPGANRKCPGDLCNGAWDGQNQGMFAALTTTGSHEQLSPNLRGSCGPHAHSIPAPSFHHHSATPVLNYC